ncbi:MAG: ATP-binding protein [archaeon]
MSYEVPQELQYREKIIFNLTFQQLGYAIIFLPISLFILKSNLNFKLKIILALIPLVIGSLFIFFNFQKTLVNLFYWIKSRRITTMSKNMINFLKIKEISNNKIKTDENISILKVEPINFNIKNTREKEAIILGFQKFLNSLDFSIQIIILTSPLNINSYLDSINIKHYKKQFQDYKNNLNSILQENKVMNRNFYIVIKETSNLDIQIKICQEKLKNIGINTKLLEDFELKEILKNLFSKDIIDKADKIVDKSNYLHYLIAPKLIKNYPDYIKINNTFNRIISTYGYPRIVEPGFLDKIITSKGDFNISLFIEPFNIENTMIMLDKELQKQRADLYSAQKNSIMNPFLELKYEDTKRILEDLQKGKEKLFNISFYINCKASSIEDLNLLTKKIESDLNSLMIIPKLPIFEMLQGLKSTTPLAQDSLKIKRNITTEALSAFFPFTSSFLNIDDDGIFLGLNKNGIPIIKNIFKLSNYNSIILSQSGSGKSFLAKLMIIRHLINDVKVMVIDPQSEYTSLCKELNGELINISMDSGTIINPLDLMEHDYAEKRLSLIDLMSVMLGDLSDIQKAVLDKALTLTYEKKGVTNNKETWNRKPPILENLFKELSIMERKCTVVEKPTFRSLLNRLSMYTDGVFFFMNRHTNINFNNKFVCFNIGEMPKQVKPVIMFLILDYVYSKMKQDRNKKILVIDEAWSLLSRTEEESYIFEIVKTCRKFNLGLSLITQDVSDLISSKAGNALLNNSSYTILLRQKPSIIDDVVKKFHLSSEERNCLLTANIGEGLLIMENDHTELKIIASKSEHLIITTNPNELNSLKNKKDSYVQNSNSLKKQEDITIDIDADKGFFLKSKLNEHEIEYLLNKGYSISSHIAIGSKIHRDYVLKPNENESNIHFFLVKSIELYIRKYTNLIYLYKTVKPDIIFDYKQVRYALEIETGKKHDMRNLRDKVELLNKNYKNWYFVVTSSKLKDKYSKYGTTFTRDELYIFLERVFKN